MTGGVPVAEFDILVNGRATATGAGTLAALVSELDFGGKRVATALNGEFIPEARRATTALEPGDKVEIVSPRQGG